MDWGWLQARYDEMQVKAEERREREQKAREEQSALVRENWRAFIHSFAGRGSGRFTITQAMCDNFITWFQKNQAKLGVASGFFVLGLVILPSIVENFQTETTHQGYGYGWLYLLVIGALLGIVLLPFIIGIRKYFKGTFTAMRLVRLDPNGAPTGRQVPMTRQDMDLICYTFRKPAKLLSVGGFGMGKYAILVEKDYTRKFILYLSAEDQSVFRASRHFWNWNLAQDSETRFYEMLEKYIYRLAPDSSPRLD